MNTAVHKGRVAKCALFFSFHLVVTSAAWSQSQYIPFPEVISSERPVVRINWVYQSAAKKEVVFDHYVTFHNLENDEITGAEVQTMLYRNAEEVGWFLFPSGDGIRNHIYLPRGVNLNRGDSLYIIFQLRSVSAREGYVFNIFQPEKDESDNARSTGKKMITHSAPNVDGPGNNLGKIEKQRKMKFTTAGPSQDQRKWTDDQKVRAGVIAGTLIALVLRFVLKTY
jgi:hypothetical protein